MQYKIIRGSGGQIKVLIKKNTRKNIGTGREKYWVDLPFIHGWCFVFILTLSMALNWLTVH